MKTLPLLLIAALASCGCGELSTLASSPTQQSAAKTADWGCPIVIGLGAKGYEGPHPGQWLRASYSMSLCAPSEWDTEWEVVPEPALLDICRDSAALAGKLCDDRVGKFLWLGTEGTYTVTARYRDPLSGEVLGEANLVVEVDDNGVTSAARSAGGCTFSLSNGVKGFGSVAAGVVAEGEGCPAPLVTWSLLTPPDGVIYRVYETRAALLADQPTGGQGRYLKVVDFIAANGVCVSAADGITTRRVGLVGTPQATCEGLP